jgi:hypothetical protein
MQLSAIQVGDVVLVDKRGARFHAHVAAKQRGELRLRPIERNISYSTDRPRDRRPLAQEQELDRLATGCRGGGGVRT